MRRALMFAAWAEAHTPGALRPAPVDLRPPLSPAAAGDLFDGFACPASGMTAAVTASRLQAPGDVHVGGLVIDPAGLTVGRFSRRLFYDRAGRLTIHNGNLLLDDTVQAHGFGRAMHRHAAAGARSLGATRMTVHASDVGGYAWAHDYEFDYPPGATPGQRRLAGAAAASVMLMLAGRRLDAIARSGVCTPRQLARFTSRFASTKKLAAADVGGCFRSPAELAGYGRAAAHDGLWLGKAFLLGSCWTGVVALDQETQGETAPGACVLTAQ